MTVEPDRIIRQIVIFSLSFSVTPFTEFHWFFQIIGRICCYNNSSTDTLSIHVYSSTCMQSQEDGKDAIHCVSFVHTMSSRMQTTVSYRKIIVHVPSEIYFTHAVVYITFDSVHFNLDEPAEPPSIMFTFLRSSHSCQWLLVYLWSKQRYSLPTKKKLKYFHVLIKSSIKC